MNFHEWLRSLGHDPDKLDDATASTMRKVFDEIERLKKLAAPLAQPAGASKNEPPPGPSREAQIFGLAEAACVNAPDKTRAAILQFGIDLARDASVSIEAARKQVMEKAVSLAAEAAKLAPAPADDSRLTPLLPADPNAILSRKEILSAFVGHGSERQAVRHAARSIVSHFRDGNEIEFRGLMEELRKADPEGRKGLVRVHLDDGAAPTVRLMSSSIVNVAIQSVLTQLLNMAYGETPPDTDLLVTPISSSAAEDTLPEVETENGVKIVKELEQYPMMGASGRSVKVGWMKFGAAVGQSRENAIFDRLGTLQVVLTDLARQLRQFRDKLRLARICDSTALDQRYISHPGDDNGAAAFYSAVAETGSGNYNLLTSNALADETDIQNVDALLQAMKKKDGTFVLPALRVLLCAPSLSYTAWKILKAVFAPSATSGQTLVPNPVGPDGILQQPVKIVRHPLVTTYAGAATTWFAGDPSKQFYEKVIWPIEVVPKLVGSEMALRDVTGLWVGSFCGEVVALSNKFFVKSTA